MLHTESLKKSFQFGKVYKRGKSIANRQLVMYIYPNKDNINRLGISVSKKVGNSVIRSRLTRLIRESYRLSEPKIVVGYDIVVIARIGIKDITYAEMEKSLIHLLRKLNLLTTR